MRRRVGQSYREVRSRFRRLYSIAGVGVLTGRNKNVLFEGEGKNRLVCRRIDLPDQRLPNASTCRPSRLRTIQNSSTVSNASEIEVAAAAPWPPKRGTSITHSTRFMTKASA